MAAASEKNDWHRRRRNAALAQVPAGEREIFKEWIWDPETLTAQERWKRCEDRVRKSILPHIDKLASIPIMKNCLQKMANCQNYLEHFDQLGTSICARLRVAYYNGRGTPGHGLGDGDLGKQLDLVCTTMSKFPRWAKMDLLCKLVVDGAPLFLVVRLMNAFDSAAEPLPRSLLRSAGYIMDYETPASDGYSVPTRIMGWGANRLSNLGCNEGKRVDQTAIITLHKFGGSRIVIFSVGVNHSLFLTEDRKLFLTGRMKNWTGDSTDERIALSPVEVQLPEEAVANLKKPPSEQFPTCLSLFADGNSSEMVLVVGSPLCTKQANAWRYAKVVAGCDTTMQWKPPHFIRQEDIRATSVVRHYFTTDHYKRTPPCEQQFIEFRGSPNHKIRIQIYHNHTRGFYILDETNKYVNQDLHVIIGNIVHKPFCIRQAAFCDNGDVYALLQIDKLSRNFVLVKGEIRLLTMVSNTQWSMKSRGKGPATRYYLVSEQVPNGEHCTQFSVDRNGENLLFETRDRPRFEQLKFDLTGQTAHDDPEVCYAGSVRNLEKLAEERARGYVIVDEESLVNLSPHINQMCPRVFLTSEMMEDLKRPIDEIAMDPKFYKLLESANHRKEKSQTEESKDESLRVTCPAPFSYYGMSLAHGAVQVKIPRCFLPVANVHTEEFEDKVTQMSDQFVLHYKKKLFHRYSEGVRACMTTRSETHLHVTIRPEIADLFTEKETRELKLLRVTYNGEAPFDIIANLWELHTPHFYSSQLHCSSFSRPIESPFEEPVMKMCERALIDPSSTEHYTTTQLLSMLEVADYMCANLLIEDLVYRLLRNATRDDISEVIKGIRWAQNTRSSLINTLARFPHILFDWPVDMEFELLYEACNRMQSLMAPLCVSEFTNRGEYPVTFRELSKHIRASDNFELGIPPNALPISPFDSYEIAVDNALQRTEYNSLLLAKSDMCQLLSFINPKYPELSRKCNLFLDESFENYYQPFENPTPSKMMMYPERYKYELRDYLESQKKEQRSPEQAKSNDPIGRSQEKKTAGTYATTAMDFPKCDEEDVLHLSAALSHMEMKEETAKENGRPQEEIEEKSIRETKEKSEEPLIDEKPCSFHGSWDNRATRAKKDSVSFADILKEEEQAQASTKSPKTPVVHTEKGKRNKFRPLSFSESGTSPKTVDSHDWTQASHDAPSSSSTNKPKSLQEIMKEQAERKSGVVRQRGPSVSGCQVEAAAIEAITCHYTDMIENHQTVTVKPCEEAQEDPLWSGDGDLHLDQD